MAAYPKYPKSCRLNSVDETRGLDHSTIHNFGIDGFTLMEIAGSGAASGIRKLEGNEKSGLYLCGKGNNAGDALVVARYLNDNAGHKADVCFLFGDGDLSPDTAHNLDLLKTLNVHGADIRFIESFPENSVGSYDYIVDGILGTGINSDLKNPLPGIIRAVNESGSNVYAMDVPTGLNADTGEIYNACILAGHTFTFGTNKTGFYLGQSSEFTGTVHFIELPFPGYLNTSSTFLLNEDLYNSYPPVKRKASHKYRDGCVHIIAGSEGLTGAAIMAARSAWKTGAGSVILYAPGKLMSIYERTLPQIIKKLVGGEQDSYFKPDDAEHVINSLKSRPGTLIAGPGIGTEPQTGEFLQSVLSEFHGSVILDADALSYWRLLTGIPDQQKQKWLITPHIGEANNYLDARFRSDWERLSWSRQFQKENGCGVLIKGNPTIYHSDNVSFITDYDTSMFARAGFGDVLAGVLGTYSDITNNMDIACVMALYEGYLAYLKHNQVEPFGPEHLI
ncbi:MAG: NAD(P)H-hydrate epimerase [Balneolaceae bacterium]|nr:MAG: NAD(P)H-hydrate epimerase [Balneolaceae bacterium]